MSVQNLFTEKETVNHDSISSLHDLILSLFIVSNFVSFDD